jgi:rSAM/selenodomain-associated transferase 1
VRHTVIVFARAPRLGSVKRRLARDIGDRGALRFHTAVLTALVRGLTSFGRFDVVLAITPGSARVRGLVGARTMPQGRGDLGERMSRALGRFRFVALMGCDIPQACAADVRDAFRALGTCDAVFGPAADGGFWLIALGPRRPADLFGGARWSTEHALADTLRQFRHRRVGFIRTLADVDSGADYCRYLASRTLHPGPEHTILAPKSEETDDVDHRGRGP